LLPDKFAEELATKTFTSVSADREKVEALHKLTFKYAFMEVTELRYGSLNWCDDEALMVARVLASGAAPKLRKLDLGSNRIGDAAMEALTAALTTTSELTTLHLHLNYLSDKGLLLLANAIAEGSLPKLRVLLLWGNDTSNTGKEAIRQACVRMGPSFTLGL